VGAGFGDPILLRDNCALARQFGVSDSLVSRIRRGRREKTSTENIYADIDRVLILTAAMTGGRQGELLALRWRDVDPLVRKRASAETTSVASTARRNRSAPAEESRWPPGSRMH
jgi:integrase